MTTSMLGAHFKQLVDGIEGTIARDPAAKSPRKLYTLAVARLGARLYDPASTVAWCGVVAPFDLLNAMGVTSCFVEFIGAMLASTGMVGTFLADAEAGGYGTDGCSYHRAVIGAARKGMMARPAFLVGTSAPCTGGLAAIEELSRIFDRDLFVLDVPQQENASTIRYLADQLRDLVAFVHDHTGTAIDDGLLADAMTKTNEARAAMVDVFRAAAAAPSPMSSKELANFSFVLALLLGTEEGVEVARYFADTFAQRLRDGAHETTGELIRLLWIQNRIQFKEPLVPLLESLGAKVVLDELNTVTWDPIDPEAPFEGIATRILRVPLCGVIDHRLDALVAAARAYGVHGAINPCNWGCRQGAGGRGMVQEALGAIGVPVMNLEVDCVDPRNFAEGQLKTRLEAFVEMLASRLDQDH